MKTAPIRPILFFIATILTALVIHWSYAENATLDYSAPNSTTTTSSENAFTTLMSVLTHQRCMNCHPNDNTPKQGEDSHLHYFGLQRGAKNQGFDALKCQTCHQSENNDYSGVPGAPHWSLAPASMHWQGLSHREIAESLIDPKRNGGRSYEDLIHHMTEDPLVLWAWNPGVNAEGIPREKPPVTQAAFAQSMTTWLENGAIIPEK